MSHTSSTPSDPGASDPGASNPGTGSDHSTASEPSPLATRYTTYWPWKPTDDDIALACELVADPRTPRWVMKKLPGDVRVLEAALALPTVPTAYREQAFGELRRGPGPFGGSSQPETWYAWADLVSRCSWLTPTRFRRLVALAGREHIHHEVTIPLLATHKHFDRRALSELILGAGQADQRLTRTRAAFAGNHEPQPSSLAVHQVLDILSRQGPGWRDYADAVRTALRWYHPGSYWTNNATLNLLVPLAQAPAPVLSMFVTLGSDREAFTTLRLASGRTLTAMLTTLDHLTVAPGSRRRPVRLEKVSRQAAVESVEAFRAARDAATGLGERVSV